MNNGARIGIGVGAAAITFGAFRYAFRKTDARLRSKVVSAAVSQVGLSDGAKYWRAVGPGMDYTKEWCGTFALWAIQQAGLAQGWTWMIGPKTPGFLYRLRITKDPKPGDIAYFTKNQHHAVVTGVTGTHVDLVNGNGTGGRVTVSTAPRSNVAAFYSIQPLVDEVL